MIARHEVVVVGARAAGAATALLLARLGHDVVLVDRAVFPSDTISTHQIARPGVVQLARWGLLDAVLASGTPALRDVHFTAGGETVTRRVKESAGVDLLVAPRRHVIDTLLLEAAVRAGADVRTGVTVSGVLRDRTGRVAGVTGHHTSGLPVVVDADWVVGADGSPPGSPGRSAPRSPSGAATTAPPSTPTSTACPGRASSCTPTRALWPGCSPPTTARPACG